MNKLPGLQFILSGLLIIFLAIWSLLDNSSNLPAGFYLLLITLGIFLLISGIRLSGQRTRLPHGLGIWVLTALLAIYTVSEITLNIRALAGHLPPPSSVPDLGFGAFNGPCAEYDSVRGYRWTKQQIRMFKMVNQELVYDNSFQINAQGYFFPSEYIPDKPREGGKRYLVLGDSFTSAEYLKTPWTVRADSLLGRDTELYSFSLDGGGLFNWHSMFFREIVPTYDFDGIVLAVFGNDLERDFFVMHHEEATGYTGYLSDIPETTEELKQKYGNALMPYAGYLSDSAMDAMVKQTTEAQFVRIPQLYALISLISIPARLFNQWQFQRFLNDMLVPSAVTFSPEEVRQGIGAARYEKIMDIIRYCQQHQKDVIIATIPYEAAIPYALRGSSLRYYAFCQTIAQSENIGFFDGTAPFVSLNRRDLKLCFLPYDIHWSQQGSDYFAEKFSTYLRNRVSSGTDTPAK